MVCTTHQPQDQSAMKYSVWQFYVNLAYMKVTIYNSSKEDTVLLILLWKDTPLVRKEPITSLEASMVESASWTSSFSRFILKSTSEVRLLKNDTFQASCSWGDWGRNHKPS